MKNFIRFCIITAVFGVSVLYSMGMDGPFKSVMVQVARMIRDDDPAWIHQKGLSRVEGREAQILSEVIDREPNFIKDEIRRIQRKIQENISKRKSLADLEEKGRDPREFMLAQQVEKRLALYPQRRRELGMDALEVELDRYIRLPNRLSEDDQRRKQLLLEKHKEMQSVLNKEFQDLEEFVKQLKQIQAVPGRIADDVMRGMRDQRQNLDVKIVNDERKVDILQRELRRQELMMPSVMNMAPVFPVPIVAGTDDSVLDAIYAGNPDLALGLVRSGTLVTEKAIDEALIRGGAIDDQRWKNLLEEMIK